MSPLVQSYRAVQCLVLLVFAGYWLYKNAYRYEGAPYIRVLAALMMLGGAIAFILPFLG